ncbi:hypothetical protein AAZX31_07G042800 [Glycine max]
MLMELAKNKCWRRCPKCNFYVEKVDGCKHITCRCGNEFCYACGSSWNGGQHIKLHEHLCNAIWYMLLVNHTL